MSLRRTKRNFSLEFLEGRIMLDATGPASSAIVSSPGIVATQKSAIGVNVPAFPNYGFTNPFVDVSKAFTQWGNAATPWIRDLSIPLTDGGYPLADAATFGTLNSLPTGVYKLSWAGTATITPVGFAGIKFTFLSAPVRGTDGRMHVDASIRRSVDSDYAFELKVTNVDPSDPLRDLRMIRPGYAEGTTQQFTDDFLRLVKPFQTLRFVDWIRWGNTDVEWSNRQQPDDFSWSGNKGTPYEAMIDLSNAVHSDLWLNVPLNADDGYVTALAQLLKGRLDPGLHAYIEYSNETWNAAGPTYIGHLANARVNPSMTVSQNDVGGLVAQQQAFEVGRLVAIFRGVYGDRFGQVIRPVLASQAANPWIAKMELGFYNLKYGAPAADGLSLAVAPYFTLDNATSADPAATVDQLFASLEKDLQTNIAASIRDNAALARANGIAMVAYESGQHVNVQVKGVAVNQAAKTAMQSDPRMGTLYDEYRSLWSAGGGSLINYYTLGGPDSVYGFWGLLTAPDQAGSAKWDAVMRQALPAGDATMDGHVDFDDFLAVGANLGSAGKYWSQGDFNGDGAVDQADLALLKAGLDPSRVTAKQLASILAFPRDATETVSGSVTPSSGSSSEARVQAAILSSAEYLAGHGGDPSGYIAGLYADILGRDADAAGLASYMGLLAGGATRADVALTLLGSAEAARAKVARWYASDLGRSAPLDRLKADPGVIAYAQMLLDGAADGELVRSWILGSPESRQRAGASTEGVVKALHLAVLGRNPDSADLDRFVGLLDGGAFTIGELAVAFLDSTEGKKTLVAAWYHDVLDRTASLDSLKGDGGVIAWSSYLR
jgi:hypothetical protein